MTTIGWVLCWSCKHYDATAPGGVFRCAAYPNGIPADIRDGNVKHTTPHDDDNGVQFEQDPERPIVGREVFPLP